MYVCVFHTGHPHTAFNFGIFAGLSSRLSLLLNSSCLRFHAALAILCPHPAPLPAALLHLQRLSLVVAVVAAVTVACLLSFIYLALALSLCLCFLLLHLVLLFSVFSPFWHGREIEFESLSDILVIKSEIFATLLFSTFS